MSDNLSLKYLFDQQNLNARQARWLAFLSEYEFEIKHIKGKENKVADALSRHENQLYMAAYSSYETDLEKKIKAAAEKDEKYQELMQKIYEGSESNEDNRFKSSKNGLLLCKNRLYVPNSTELKVVIFDEVHKKPYSGHPGYQKTVTMLRKNFYWPKMKGEVAEYLARCLECQLVKAEHQHPVAAITHP